MENKLLSIVTIITISFSILIVSAFILFITNVEHSLNNWIQDVRIMAYLQPGLSADQKYSIEEQLQSFQGVKQVLFISNEDALDILKHDMQRQSSIFDDLKHNPLPDSFEIYLFNPAHNLNRFEELAIHIEKIEGISEVEYGQKWLGRIAGFFYIFKITAYGLGVLFFVAAVFFVANTIRLVLYSRRDEIQIMRLVGASEHFIKTPFYIKSLIQGALGGIIGISALYIAFRFLNTNITSNFPDNFFQLAFLSSEILISIFGISLVVGWLGCYLSLKRFFT